MNCTQCGKETDTRYIIDAAGNRYCMEECMENHQENKSFDDTHPYEDAYLMLRHNYIELIDQWEEKLSQKAGNLEEEVDELLDEIDELISDHSNFIYSEGDDGPYAWEIYQYTLKLRELQRHIFIWRPDRKLLYWINGTFDDYSLTDEQKDEIYNRIYTDLYLEGYEDFVLYIVKNHQHPWHWGLNHVFDNAEMAEEAYEILKPFCDKYKVELSIVESHKCEGSCGDILETDADTYINGWFYCYSCKENKEHGIFTQKELEVEIQYYEEHEEERQMLIYERMDWCYSYKQKIKRSCRALMIEAPTWAE